MSHSWYICSQFGKMVEFSTLKSQPLEASTGRSVSADYPFLLKSPFFHRVFPANVL